MDLSLILHRLHVKDGLPVLQMLSQLQFTLRDALPIWHPDLPLLEDVGQLLENGDRHWLFCESCSPGLTEGYRGLLRCLLELAALPLCEQDCGDLPLSEYVHIPARAAAICALLQTMVCRLAMGSGGLACGLPSGQGWSLLQALAPHICVFTVSHLQEQPWTNSASRRAAAKLLESVVLGCGFESNSQLLCGTNRDSFTGILAAVLETLRPALGKENWKRNPATKHVFFWVLTHVNRPNLEPVLETVFPAALLISDDYRTENQVLGVRCLHHIIVNVPAADLRQFNRAQVMYHALLNHLYRPEAELLQAVLLCLLDLLPVLEKPCGVPSAGRRKPNRYDQVLRLVLTHMEMEHKLMLRRVYAQCLALYVPKMDLVTIRHLKKLQQVIVGYLEVSDGPGEEARISILCVLEEVIKNAWPRVECRLPVLLQTLLRLLCDTVADGDLPQPVREELLGRATRCLQLLDFCSQGKLKELLKDVDSSCAEHTVLQCLEQVRKSN